MTRVKVCGLMNEKDVKLCVQAGVDVLGFVVEYPSSVPWDLTATKAKELISKVPPFISTSIVVGGSVEKILNIVDETHPNIVQLHYKETMQEIKVLVQELSLRGIKVIKALRLDSEDNCDFEITDPVMAAKELAKIGLSAILVDSYTKARPGGTGIQVNSSTFKNIQMESPLPVILAGGLNPDNISSVVNEFNPYAVDVLTGVEKAPNHKDIDKIKRFMKCCKIL